MYLLGRRLRNRKPMTIANGVTAPLGLCSREQHAFETKTTTSAPRARSGKIARVYCRHAAHEKHSEMTFHTLNDSPAARM